jgi:hypothetical protein
MRTFPIPCQLFLSSLSPDDGDLPREIRPKIGGMSGILAAGKNWLAAFFLTADGARII